MKKYLFLYVVAFACFAENSFAQLKIGDPATQKTPLLQIPMVHITPVESLFVPVHIDMLKPFTVSLNPIVFGEHENAACAHLKKLKATLVLSAERVNDIAANLKWETKYAFYATGFTIERSFADSFHFVTVNFAAVSKATSFKVNYTLPDPNDYSGLCFYRVKQNNGDSGFVYSNIVSIKGIETTRPFRIYPIPAIDKVWIDVLSKQTGSLNIIIYDPAGKIVWQQTVSCAGNRSTVQGIDIAKLAAGLYQVKILLPDKTSLSGKFIKQ